MAEQPCCPSCSCSPQIKDDQARVKITDKPWIERYASTPVGEIPVVRTELLLSDRLGIYRARWSGWRAKFRVAPGLYAVGNPDTESPVFVTANYKMSFDRLRSELGGIDGWIMVLDTRGINVWCAAGKGTFGTDEIVGRIEAVGLDKIVSKKKLILPQLGAPGVSAHKVKERSGFKIRYGPVKAKDLPAFLKAGNRATPEMRRVTFNMWERAVLIPNDIVQNFKYLFFTAIAFLILSGFGSGIYSPGRVITYGIPSVILLSIAYLAGMILPQLFLPYIPGRSFSAKGAWIGALAAVIACWFLYNNQIINSYFGMASWLFIIPAITSFIFMNFTGVSTYTSLSGVVKEMKTAIPVQIASAVIGIGLWITGLFV
ncbi:MAG: acetyl-CoA synthase subunit gamma [Candidatus Zixiibacteriota bacterium]|nr:MAG: acetyl-CoA synthase subunit gamma [candidate division Zixibacteria bacterium]